MTAGAVLDLWRAGAAGLVLLTADLLVHLHAARL